MTLQEYMEQNFTVIDATSQVMPLKEAIEVIRDMSVIVGADLEWDNVNFACEDKQTAIATILNAVVKGELAQVEKQDPYWKTY